MASDTKATSHKEDLPEKETPEGAPDGPLLDFSDAAVKKLIRSAKKRGYVTHDQINLQRSLIGSEYQPIRCRSQRVWVCGRDNRIRP